MRHCLHPVEQNGALPTPGRGDADHGASSRRTAVITARPSRASASVLLTAITARTGQPPALASRPAITARSKTVRPGSPLPCANSVVRAAEIEHGITGRPRSRRATRRRVSRARASIPRPRVTPPRPRVTPKPRVTPAPAGPRHLPSHALLASHRRPAGHEHPAGHTRAVPARNCRATFTENSCRSLCRPLPTAVSAADCFCHV